MTRTVETPEELFLEGSFFRLSAVNIPQTNTSIEIQIKSRSGDKPWVISRKGCIDLAMALLDFCYATAHLDR